MSEVHGNLWPSRSNTKKAGLDEKNSGNDRDLNAISDFRNVVQDCNLMDMGSQGYLFT